MFGLFKRKKPKTLLDGVNSSIVDIYRPYLVNNKNLPDEKILEIVQTVMRAFQQASESKQERLSGTTLMNIGIKFIKVYDLAGPDFFIEHLKYEINLYLTSGLREDYL
jgi:hypothetical protein